MDDLSSSAPRPQEHPARLFNLVAIVTGASSGLGRAIALAYASHGTRVVVCADLHAKRRTGDYTGDDDPALRSDLTTHELIEQVYGKGRAVFVKCDVGEAADVKAAVAEAVNVGGRLDVMVNNAGLGVSTPELRLHEESDEAWDIMLRVNLRGVYLGCKHALGQMLAQPLLPNGRRGYIVNVSSMLGHVGLAGGAGAYCASKGGVLNLTRQIALDYARDRIHCNALCPGFTRTSMTRVNFDDASRSEVMQTATPWGVWGTAADVAKAAVFLASDDAAWVTGVGLPVDGGYTAQ